MALVGLSMAQPFTVMAESLMHGKKAPCHLSQLAKPEWEKPPLTRGVNPQRKEKWPKCEVLEANSMGQREREVGEKFSISTKLVVTSGVSPISRESRHAKSWACRLAREVQAHK